VSSCKPVTERTGEVGCWIIAHEPIGQLNQSQVFWHLDVYPSRAAAQEAKGPQGTVVESLGKIWLLTISDAGWRPPDGERIAEIGPLPITAGENYSAQYMEAIFTPGMTAAAHTHSGPEAWHTLSGETCLETRMKRFIEGTDRSQSTLFPESLEDWIEEDNPLRVIDVFVNGLDLRCSG
jgi:quercetin dioxygenase-like cupin family protein